PWQRDKRAYQGRYLLHLLSPLPGSYKLSDRASIQAARTHHDLLSLQEAEALLARHFQLLNEQVRSGKPSRLEMWRSTHSLPAPSVQKLVASGYFELPGSVKESGVLADT